MITLVIIQQLVTSQIRLRFQFPDNSLSGETISRENFTKISLSLYKHKKSQLEISCHLCLYDSLPRTIARGWNVGLVRTETREIWILRITAERTIALWPKLARERALVRRSDFHKFLGYSLPPVQDPGYRTKLGNKM